MKYLCIQDYYEMKNSKMRVLYEKGLTYDIEPYVMYIGEFSGQKTHYVTIYNEVDDSCYLSDEDILPTNFILFAKYREDKINDILNGEI